MHIVGYVLLAVGVISIVGNLTGGGSVGDPDPLRARSRLGCYAVFILAGGLLVWLGS